MNAITVAFESSAASLQGLLRTVEEEEEEERERDGKIEALVEATSHPATRYGGSMFS